MNPKPKFSPTQHRAPTAVSRGAVAVRGTSVCAVAATTAEHSKPVSAIAFSAHVHEARKNKHFVTAQKSSPFTRRHVAHQACVHSRKAVELVVYTFFLKKINIKKLLKQCLTTLQSLKQTLPLRQQLLNSDPSGNSRSRAQRRVGECVWVCACGRACVYCAARVAPQKDFYQLGCCLVVEGG